MYKVRQNHLNLRALLFVAMCSSLVGCPIVEPPPPSPTCSPPKLTLSCDTGTGDLGGEADVTNLATNQKGFASIGANAGNDAVCSAMVNAVSQVQSPYQRMSLTSVRFCGAVNVTVCGAQFSCLPANSCTDVSSGAPKCDNWPQLHAEKQTQDNR